jgi:hypothetical protein
MQTHNLLARDEAYNYLRLTNVYFVLQIFGSYLMVERRRFNNCLQYSPNGAHLCHVKAQAMGQVIWKSIKQSLLGGVLERIHVSCC